MKSTRQAMAVAIGIVLSGAVAAQTPGSPASGTSRTTPSAGAGSPAGAPAAVSPAAAATHQLKAARLSKLDGVNIYDSNAKKIGEVEDVVVDPASGRVLHAVVSMGGVLGVGDKKYDVPTKELSVFSKSADDSVPLKVTLGASPESLAPAKKMDKDSPYVMGSQLVGMDVEDSNGKNIGEIEDAVVDVQSGELQYALMEFDKSWSVNDKLFAFKMSEFQKAKDGNKMVLNVTKESLNDAPSIDKSAIDKTDLSDASWVAKLGQGTGVAAGAAPAGSATTGSAASSASPAGSTPATGTPPAGTSTPAPGTK